MQNQIPKNWQKVKLGYVLGQKGYIRGPFGSSLRRGELLTEGIPVYEQQNAIYDNRNFRFYINEKKFNELRRFAVQPNDLVISCSGSLGKVTIIRENDPKGIISQALLILRPEIHRVLSKYLYYFLTSAAGFRAMTSRSTGSALVNIAKREIIEDIELSTPPITIQKIIVEILSSFDDKIEVNNKIAKTLAEMAQALFKEWFVHFRFPEYEKVEFVDSELGKIPKGWKIGKLKELVNIRNGFAFKSSDYESKGIPIVRTMNFTDKGSVQLNDHDIVYLSIEKAKKYKSFYLEEFDFLLVMVGASVGKWSIVPSNILPALQNQNMWDFMPKKEEYRFFNIYLLKKIIREQRGSTTGSARDFFRKDYFYSLNVFIPNSEILQEFNSLVEPIYRRLNTILNENQKLAALRDLLLPKLMRGEIRI